ncbi:right-handed parallel beta-helix repeat-containing protein [Mycobacterium sp. ENV421]|uniref:beta strand repeat-containing protein n=1 Tax=Mycobacterium sp. ENV421 TaxID=1213407 RepID=UPI0013049477|nr:right-handed parallel beta-helix repeat-containing protein [Mycobacterium sp. ENV421]
MSDTGGHLAQRPDGNRANRRTRIKRRPLRVTAWLGIGAATLGMGAVLAGSVGIANADTGGPADHPGATAPAKKDPGSKQGVRASTARPASSGVGTSKRLARPLSSASPTASTARLDRRSSAPTPGAASARAVRPAVSAPAAPFAAPCAACWGVGAPTVTQSLTTATNHLFNVAYQLLDGGPGNPISTSIEGALVLIRRTLFFVPTGITATQVGTALTVGVNSGSVAYFRQSGSQVQVADNPLFWGAQEFAAPSLSDVTVSNAGATGCAGFDFAKGTVAADLVANQIDSIEFGPGAAFGGTVTLTDASSPISIRTAVRGSQGVTIDGQVLLASNVEIDAGTGNAVFNNTVDARQAGKQSLLVSALGTTTFAAAIGSRTPLASLTTRAIAPIDITQSADSKTIPLHYMPTFSADGRPQVKYGIDVAIGDNAPRTYLFDSGGNGFYAGYTPSYWQDVQLGTNSSDITYTSGNFVDAVATTTTITIGTGQQTVTTQPIQIGAIIAGGNKNDGSVFDFSDPDATPWDGRFVGDFGAAFGVQPVDNQAQGLTSALFQLPGNLSSGFLAQLGPIGSQPQLTVGVTDALRAQFPYAVPVSALTGGGVYPVSGYQVLQQFGFAAQYFVTQQDTGLLIPLGTESFAQCAQQCLPSLIDSGAPSTSVRLPGAPTPYPLSTANNSALQPGSIFVAELPTTQGRPPLTWTFTAGTNGSVDQVGYDSSSGAATTTQNVNTGLNLYNDFDIMFDVAKQVIWLRPNGGQSTVSLQSVATTGAQTYGQNAILSGTYSTGGGGFSISGVTRLAGDVTVDSGSGDATFSGTVDGTAAGGQSLTVNAGGTTTFVRQVGALAALKSLTTDTPGSTVTSGVTTADGQTYHDDLSINGAYSGSSFAAGKSTVLAGPSSITVGDGSIAFAGTIDSQIEQLPSDTGVSPVKTGFTLEVSAQGGTVGFGAKVGGTSELGGLTIDKNTSVTAADTVNLVGSLVNSGQTGIEIGDGATVRLRAGGSITGFTGSGIVFQGGSQGSEVRGFHVAGNVYDGIQFGLDNASSGVPVDFAGTVIAENTIYGNSAFGIEAAAPVLGLTIRDNTIGATGQTNEWGFYVTPGPNTHGIVLAPGLYTGTTIYDNTITDNARSGIFAPGGVQGLLITGNTIKDNQLHGIEFATGDFTSTVITGNTISANGSDGISLGAGIGQATTAGGNPLTGYTAGLGHYVVSYANNPDFYDPTTPPADPQIQLQIGAAPHGTTNVTVNLDTGSRGLYFDALQLPAEITGQGTQLGKGYVYLNSSNRLFFGDWVQLPITFSQSAYVDANGTDQSRRAQASVPVLVVSAVGASMTPMPGSTVPNTTFGTTVSTGTIVITNGSQTQQATIVTNPSAGPGKGTVTIPGGWWANYADNIVDGNELLAPVANFGIGFDRSGQGTAPTTNEYNQAYNAFLNLTEMQDGAMRPGYVLSAGGVTLGLDSAVTGFAYTDLAPTGLQQGTQSAPDWQPATGTVTYENTTYGTGQLVIDMGIPTGILTLPGQTPTSSFSGKMTVDLLNSGGSNSGVSYHFQTDSTGSIVRADNLLAPTDVAFFNPLAGNYTENMAPQSQQFFNTGRDVFAAFDYLYDAAGGYFGVKVGSTQQAQDAFAGNGEFTAAHFENPNAPTGVDNLTITGNTISDNGGDGVSIIGADNVLNANTIAHNTGDGVAVSAATSTGNSILSNSIHSNAGHGIALTYGANGGQPAPSSVSATLVDNETQVRVHGTVTAVGGYSGQFEVQVFGSPPSEGVNAQGRHLLGSFTTSAGDFSQDFSVGPDDQWITVTATPVTAPANTSEFSTPVSDV